MPRVARVVVAGVPHHVTQRGNNRQDVFFVDDDRRMYLRILAQQCAIHRVAVIAYCLMTNHVHLVIIPAATQALSRAVGRTNWLYTLYINRLHKRSGHLWQNRFNSCPLDEEGALLASRYVDQNPVRARICRSAKKYSWSSAAAHCGGRDTLALLDLRRWRDLCGRKDWRAVLAERQTDFDVARLRRATHTGRPLAGDSWLSKLEKRLGRRLRAQPVGRPKGKKKTGNR